MAQSPGHVEEAAAMRAFDAVMQRAGKLNLRARRRVLIYMAGVLAEHREEVDSQLAVAAQNLPAYHGDGVLDPVSP